MVTLTPELPAPDAALGAHSPQPDGEVAASASASGRFQSLYAEHFAMVWRSLRALGVNEASVEDAVQDVFLVVHRRLPEFAARSSVRTWVFGIVLGVARNHRRRERRKGPCVPLEAELAGRGPDPHDEAVTAEALARVARALGTLDEAKREIFVMGEMEQMTAQEIAEALGINVNTAYSRLRAARAAFATALARDGGRR
jgi:RNA polymerase sigma-70 factor (ECF subfamily)